MHAFKFTVTFALLVGYVAAGAVRVNPGGLPEAPAVSTRNLESFFLLCIGILHVKYTCEGTCSQGSRGDSPCSHPSQLTRPTPPPRPVASCGTHRLEHAVESVLWVVMSTSHAALTPKRIPTWTTEHAARTSSTFANATVSGMRLLAGSSRGSTASSQTTRA